MMELEKAIETLTDFYQNPNAFFVDDLPAAVKLGIEALKRFQEGRPKCFISTVLLLPGETPPGDSP